MLIKVAESFLAILRSRRSLSDTIGYFGFLRDSLSAIAMACFGFLTMGPFLEPECNFPCLKALISSDIMAFLEDFFGIPIRGFSPQLKKPAIFH